MLHLRSGRVPNVILRSVATVSVRLQSSTSCLPANAKDIDEHEQEGTRIPRKKGRPVTTNLAFTIPGLSAREERYLKQQVQIILKPDCLTEFTADRKQHQILSPN